MRCCFIIEAPTDIYVDGLNNPLQKCMVLLIGGGFAPSFHLHEDERAQHGVPQQGAEQRQVRKEPPEARIELLRLWHVFCLGHLAGHDAGCCLSLLLWKE